MERSEPRPQGSRDFLSRALFTIAIFFGSFLLFLVEPLAAKTLLPRFGGSAEVWNACLVFFQVALLLGYGYAHLGSSRRGRVKPLIHLALVIAAVVMVPLTILPSGSPTLHSSGPIGPALAVIVDLAFFCGLPFFTLSAGSSLIQLWYSRTHPDAGEPYFLYGASNAGSLVGLLICPFVLEPLVGLKAQGEIWRIGYAVNLFLLMGIVALLIHSPGIGAESDDTLQNDAEPTAAVSAPSWKERGLWVILAAAPTSLLLGVTTYLTTNIAPIPLLWVIPLALYLVTFIIAFRRGDPPNPGAIGRWVPMLAAPLAIAMILESTQPLIPLALFHLAVVFLITLGCHSRLSSRRPHPTHLTEYFLWIALGGALGGIFNVLVAPLIFTTLAEYPLAIAVGAALVLSSKSPTRDKAWKWSDFVWPVAVAASVFIGDAIAQQMQVPPSMARTLIDIGLPALICFLASDIPWRFGAALGALFIASSFLHTSANGEVIFSGRSFYGVHRVLDTANPPLRRLVHGNTTHGIESLEPGRRDVPLTYYSQQGPIGQIFESLNHQGYQEPVGLVGLGVGSLAAYGVPGEEMDYFEIDPVVIWLARDSGIFHFLGDCKANLKVVEGDGRLALQEQPNGKFGVLVFDAFTSDSIPVHLLTEDAIKMYLSKLKPGGFIAFHISNRYLNLGPVLAADARDLGLVVREDKDDFIDDQQLKAGITASDWLVMARSKDDLPKPARSWDEPSPAAHGWTDDLSNLVSAFKLGGGL